MGYYIDVIKNKTLPAKGKAQAILNLVTDAKEIEQPKEFQDNLVCVVENALFDAAGYVYSKEEFEAFTYPGDSRKKRWFIVPDADIYSDYRKVEKTDNKETDTPQKRNYILQTGGGDVFERVCQKAKAKAEELKESGTNVQFEFNGKTVVIAHDTDLGLINRDYELSWLMDWTDIGPYPDAIHSDELKGQIEAKREERKKEEEKREQEYQQEMERKNKLVEEVINGVDFLYADKVTTYKKVEGSDEPKEIELSGEESMKRWEKSNESEEDPAGRAYAMGIINYAKRWARMMQKKFTEAGMTEVTLDEKFSTIAEETSREADTEGITGFMYGAAVQVLVTTWKFGPILKRWHNKKYGKENADGVVNPAILTITV